LVSAKKGPSRAEGLPRVIESNGWPAAVVACDQDDIAHRFKSHSAGHFRHGNVSAFPNIPLACHVTSHSSLCAANGSTAACTTNETK